MSSILDALQKLESRRTQTDGPEPPHRGRRSITPLLASAALVAFAAGIAIAAVWLRPRASTPAPATVAQAPPPPTTPPAASAPAASPPATPPPPPAQRPAAPARPTEQPWAEVVLPTPARDTAPPVAGPAIARTPARERSPDAAEPAAMIAAVAPPATAPPPPAAAPAPRASARPAGAPSVRVSFLVYSSAAERRTVSLAIDQGGLVTLHEGEGSNGLSVAQILPDGVELRWQGQSFRVPARD